MIKKLFSILITILIALSIANAAIYNEQGDFKIELDSQKQVILNDNINSVFTFKVENLKTTVQDFKLQLPDVKGWDITTQYEVFTLSSKESKEITVSFVANSDFDYSTNLVSPDVIKISQKEDYKGYFEFPITVLGDSQSVSMKFQLEIDKKELIPESFSARFATEELSPISPLRYTVTGENLMQPQEVEVSLEIDGIVLSRTKETFSKVNNYKIFQTEIPSSFNPGTYEVRLIIRLLKEDGRSAQEWYETRDLKVVPYQKIIAERKFENTVFGEKHSILLNNTGNVESTFTEEVKTNLFTLIFLGASQDYEKTEDGIKFDVPLEKSQSTVLYYSYNYMFIYLLFLVLALLFGNYYVRKHSNPLKIEKKIYEVRKVEHEGIKSLRVKLDFENIKEEQIEELKVVFKIPSYLNVKENSFLLVEPNHVLKGKDMYKLVWDFKRFEMNDSRILGFTLVNSKGVLGDINLPGIEFEVKVNGKLRKYSEELPIIRH